MQPSGERGGGRIFPRSNHRKDREESEKQRHKRHDPCGAIESRSARRSQHRWSVFLYESWLHQAVPIPAADGGHKFISHAIGIGAADMVTLQQNLVAAANAHELMTDFVEAGRGIAGAGEHEDGERYQQAVQVAPASFVENYHSTYYGLGPIGPAGLA